MTWSPGPVVTRRRLGGELRRLREGTGLKLEDVARKLECSPSKISRLENGKGVPRWRDVRDMLDTYDVSEGPERDRLLDWTRTGRAPMWWSQYSDVLAADMALYVEYEWDAARIDAYEVHVVHGLLQTRDYARGVLRSARVSLDEAAIDRLVEVRMRRQEALKAEHGLMFRCVVDESVLYRVVDGPDVLARQVEHLIEIAEAEHVDLRVLPFSAGLVPESGEAFSTLRFSAGIEHGLVFVERPAGASAFLADPSDVTAHDTRMAALIEASLPEEESVPLMKRALRRTADA